MITDTSKWKYGAEHELSDWNIHSELPESVKRNKDDYSIVNSNGIANDPSGNLIDIGGELNTIPTDSIDEQVEILRDIKSSIPDVSVNYHSNLHLHISIPGLVDNLEELKYFQKRIHLDMPILLDIIDPLECNIKDYNSEEDYKIARKRINHSKISRHKLLTNERLNNQLHSNTIDEFFNSEPPISKSGKPLFHLSPRLCINLRSLKDNGTIEFRHWAGTLDEDKFKNAFEWCFRYIYLVCNHLDIDNDFIEYSRNLNLPKQELVDVRLEKLFNLTSIHKVDRCTAKNNIAAIKEGLL